MLFVGIDSLWQTSPKLFLNNNTSASKSLSWAPFSRLIQKKKGKKEKERKKERKKKRKEKKGKIKKIRNKKKKKRWKEKLKTKIILK